MKRVSLCLFALLLLFPSVMMLTSCQKRTYSLTFISEGEQFAVVEGTELDELKPPEAYPAKEGCAFAGWYLDDGSFEKALPNEYEAWAKAAKKRKGEKTLTLYARFVEAPLLPMMIEAAAFKTLTDRIKQAAPLHTYNQFMAYYGDYTSSNALHAERFPILAKRNTTIYVLNITTSDIEKEKLAGWLATYCPDYTYADLAKHHAEVEYDGYLYP